MIGMSMGFKTTRHHPVLIVDYMANVDEHFEIGLRAQHKLKGMVGDDSDSEIN